MGLCCAKVRGREKKREGEEVYRHYAREVGMCVPGVLPRISGRNVKLMIKTSDLGSIRATSLPTSLMHFALVLHDISRW